MCVMNSTVFQLLAIILFGIYSSEADNFCNQTIRERFHTPCMICRLSSSTKCPDGSIQLTRNRGKRDCQISGTVRIRGCRHACLQETEVPTCCGGYWGPQCDREYYYVFRNLKIKDGVKSVELDELILISHTLYMQFSMILLLELGKE